MVGKRFGRLLVLEPSTPGRQYSWKCICDCGLTKHALGVMLRKGQAKSCGCLQPRRIPPIGGKRRTPLQRARYFGVGYEPNITLRTLIKRRGDKCGLCGFPVIIGTWGVWNPLQGSIDHIVPMVRGGEHTWSNVQVAHHVCNTGKHTRVGKSNRILSAF